MSKNGVEKEEEDEFWRLALAASQPLNHDDSDDDESDDDGNLQSTTRLETYALPSGITFTVSSLAETEGIMSPLGAKAWHASSLLSIYLILHHDRLFKDVTNGHDIHCLELGSGAVGLSGMTLAAVLNGICPRHATVLLTDLAQDGILTNLEANACRNKSMFPQVNVQVQPLDWNDYRDNEAVPSLPSVDLVLGSELVYTDDTAVACAAVVTRLLRDNPKLVVLIIQVMDRPGFETTCLPILQKDFEVRVEQPLDAELHDLASSVVVLGGTLDRFVYGACWIRNKPT